ncbi:MAG: hypothetical protein SLAVMIC_00840 [uncultured marine phage]|uniref:Uncharacterized protein n=1 Tax=uncultured marine phage TaxID=707152 RepID=A0A8D9FSG8_9VIRU|nr:MAG: hypothetical protein SLAVMIC_00840 [uncultured marine phage]
MSGERRVFTIPIGNIDENKDKREIKKLLKEYKSDIKYDYNTGTIIFPKSRWEYTKDSIGKLISRL